MTEHPSIAGHPSVDQWIELTGEGRIIVHTGKVDIGQRLSTALAIIVSEELDVEFENIDVKPAQTGTAPDEGYTAGSMSMQQSGTAVRLACATARRHLRIVARTDAAAESLNEAIRRAHMFLAAGADIIFPDALSSDDDFRRFCAEVKAPILVNMTEFGRTPMRTAAELEDLGCKIVIWPVSSLRVAAAAVSSLYGELAASGSAKGKLNQMQSRAQLYEAIRYHDFEALDETIARSVLPEPPQ